LVSAVTSIGVLRMFGDQGRLGVRPAPSAILLKIPFVGDDLGKEPAARLGVGNEAAIGRLRVPADQHLADIEDDVADFGHAACFSVAPGRAASIAFFMTLGSASPGSESKLDHHARAGALCFGPTSAR
jgi:hypothetical protein